MKILFVSLGCDKNLVDSEVMLGILRDKGFTFTDDESEADVVVVNTCCFIQDAKEESIEVLLRMGELKSTGKAKVLIAAGCLAQRYREELRREIPEVDAIVGTTAMEDIAAAVEEALAGQGKDHYREAGDSDVNRRSDRNDYDSDADVIPGIAEADGACDKSVIDGLPATSDRVLTTGGHYAYLKIAEGCDKHCTYCVIPKVRGSYRSVPMENLVAEASKLAEGGVKELILVAQETTLYGVDLYGQKKLPELLRRLAKISGIYWIRILYCYPEEITEELIAVIAAEPKICHYLDIPIQHISGNVLKRMGRRTNQEELRRMIAKLRERIPNICLRTTLISGFPGETQDDFEELYRFVNEMEFDRLGVFTYSREEDTPAAGMPGQVAESVKKSRRDELMELQQAVAFEKAQDMVGRVLTVMVEGKAADEDVYVTRTYRDAPNVDGYLFLNTGVRLMTGDFVKVRVTDSNGYDLIGEIM